MAKGDRIKAKEIARLEASAETHFLAGLTLSATWEYLRGGPLTRKRLTEIRDRLFDRLKSSPDNVKALAEGPILNANELVRYRHPRPVKNAPPPVQLSILDIVDGHMGRA